MKIQILKQVTMLISFLVVLNNLIISQNISDKNYVPQKADIILLAKSYKDSVVLRWAPSTPGGWLIANKIGYNIEKIRITTNTPIENEKYIKLNKSPLKPIPLEEWKSKASKDNIFSAIAVQSIYGKSFNPKPLEENNLKALKNAADELTNRYSLALFAADNDAGTAEAMGLRFVDKEVKEGDSYAYRVFVSEKNKDYNFDTAYIIVKVTSSEKVKGPENISFESGDCFITIKWEENDFNKFSGYYIFRSEDGKNFKKINNIPLIITSTKEQNEKEKLFFRDTATINYKKYHYKVYGITPFGELSEPSEIVAYSKDLTPPPAPLLEKPKLFVKNEIVLSWKIEKPTNDFVGFVVARSNNSINNFQIITPKTLPKNTFKFTDKVSNYDEVYYSVGSVDTAGNMSFSLPQRVILLDTMPPSIPKGLTGTIDSNGIVKLKWNMGPEWNLLGYRVLRSNDPNHEFQQLTGNVYQDTIFTDTVNIKTLTKNVYYRIAAVNTRYQHSDLSPILTLKRPDKIPPVEAVFKNIFTTDTSITLSWVPSTSKDLLYQKIMRRKIGEDKWTTIDSLSKSVFSYTDNKVEKTVKYEYTIISFDESELSSIALPVSGMPYDKGDRPKVDKLSARYDEKNNSVIIEWNYNHKIKEKYWFVLYKGFTSNKCDELKALDSNTTYFIDKDIAESNVYYYAISIKTSMGGQSEKVFTSVNIPQKIKK